MLLLGLSPPLFPPLFLSSCTSSSPDAVTLIPPHPIPCSSTPTRLPRRPLHRTSSLAPPPPFSPRSWHLKPIRCLMCSQIGAERGSIPPKLSQIIEERHRGLSRKTGINTISLIHRETHSQETCVCACQKGVGWITCVYCSTKDRPAASKLYESSSLRL